MINIYSFCTALIQSNFARAVFLKILENMNTDTFKGLADRYDGVTVDTQEEPCEKTLLSPKITGRYHQLFLVR